MATHPVRGAGKVTAKAVLRSDSKRTSSQKRAGSESSKLTRSAAIKRSRVAADIARLTPEQRKAYLARQPKPKATAKVQSVAEAVAEHRAELAARHETDGVRPTGFGVDSYDYF